MGVITAIRTAHPVLDARRLSTSEGYRFEDGERFVRVWKGDAYVGRVPYEAIVLIEEEVRTVDDVRKAIAGSPMAKSVEAMMNTENPLKAFAQDNHRTQGKRKHRR
jgi:hypothetical protein